MNYVAMLIPEVHPANSASLMWALEDDRMLAPKLLTELLAEPPVVRERMAVTLVRFRSLALAGLLVERSLERRAAGEEPAELALAILGVLDPSWKVIIDQGRARAWGALANVYRLRGDLGRAEEAWFRASWHLANAPDPLEEAHFYRLRARLFRDRGQVAGAMAIQNRAIKHLARFAAPEIAAEALVELAVLHLHTGEREEALAALARACEAFQRNG